ncbi:ABC transporter substrate-binding protein [Brucella anthropi]|uniref:ABC transporter substrate-binding protein n=1 Tax=Brucella anthropi TaxID=529 RepID=UPI001CFF1262|nr:ABC transporter substrate-binding protein [Brucella anthropi]
MSIIKKLLVGAVFFAPSIAQAEQLTFATAGGTFLETVQKVCLQPFMDKTGLDIKTVATEDTGAQIRAQMMTKRQWDIVESASEVMAIGTKNGWFQALDWEKIDPDKTLPEIARNPYGMGFTTYSEGIAYRTDRANGKIMKSWKDFWDVEKFPGNRSLRDTPLRNLEYALMADGVEQKDIYTVLATPEGADRAFAKLDKIKEHVKVWWTAGQQPSQYLASGDVDYSSIWNGRVTTAVKEGVPLGFVWDQAALITGYYAVLKGSPMLETGVELLKSCWMDPKVSAEFVKHMPYASFAPGLYDLIPEELAKQLSTYPDNKKVQFEFNGAFWAEHRPALQERWQRWRLGN